jgi:hypothetical protein
MIVTRVKSVPDKIAYIYEYADREGKIREKIVLMDIDTPVEQLKHLEPALEGHYCHHGKPRLVLVEPITVEINIS